MRRRAWSVNSWMLGLLAVGAAIYYTTDGSTLTTSTTQYTGEINVAANTTMQAYAVKAGMSDSAVVSATYTVYVPNSGGAGAPTPNTNATATDPLNGV